MKNHSEKETFRALIKRPYEEVKGTWDKVLRDGFSTQKAIEELGKLGWKKDEFYKEWSRRNNWKN